MKNSAIVTSISPYLPAADQSPEVYRADYSTTVGCTEQYSYGLVLLLLTTAPFGELNRKEKMEVKQVNLLSSAANRVIETI